MQQIPDTCPSDLAKEKESAEYMEKGEIFGKISELLFKEGLKIGRAHV